MARKRNMRKKPSDGSPPSSLKKFRQSPEIESFYRFIYENDLRVEAFQVIDRISQERKAGAKKKK